MSEECKALEKKAKSIEKENPTEAIDLYRQASECFGHDESPKNKNSNLEKAAKLLRGLGKSTEDPTEALDHYEDSSSIYNEIGKEGDAEKVMQEAYQKFIGAAKLISSEARKMDIADAAEQKFKLAAGYAALAGDNKLSNKCWIESADQFYEDAKEVENPREAFEVFKHAILNYKKGKADEKFDLLLKDAAEKFTKIGSEILKTKKTLVLAIGNFLQAENIYRFISSDQKSQESDLKIQEICERIGMVKDAIIHYLESQGITAVSFSDLPSPTPQPDKEELSVPISDVEPVVQDISIDEEPLSSIPEPTPEIKEKTEPEISPPEISPPMPKLVTDDVEVGIEEEPTIEAFIDELDPLETSEAPTTPEVLPEPEEIVDPRPVKHGIPETTSKLEADEPGEEPTFETPTEEIDPIEIIQTPTTPKVISEPEEIVDPRPVKHGIPGPTVKLDAEVPEEEPTFEAPTDEIDSIETIQTPTTPEVISEPEAIVDPRPVKHGIPGPTVKFEAEDPKDEVSIESPLDMPVDDLDKPEIDKLEIEQPVEIPLQEVVSDIEEKYEPEMVKEEIIESPPTFESIQTEVTLESKPAPSIEEIDDSEMEHAATESTSEVDDYLKSRFDPDAESIEETTGIVAGSSDTDIAQEAGSITRLSEPIVKILKEQGYLTEDTTKSELLQVPEYQILLFILNNHPVPLEEIEEKTDVSSISLGLSNLQADGLVEQTNDYQWTVSKKVTNS